MQCPRCQHENRDGRRFCSKCGAALAAACSSCGFTNEPGDAFCGGCGASLAGPRQLQARFTPPDTYTPKHLAEKILTSKAALEGERKQVTVLFADLKGSMELLADRDPEEARKVLDPVLERMMEAVHHYEGTVNQVMGDGIMALFGAPVAHEDHAIRASYAALRMQRRINLYADEIQRAGGTPVQIRVGLNSGEVVVRSIGSDLHMDYTAVGQTTHLAARMEQMAKPGSVLVTGETLKLAEGYVQVRPLGAVAVKGLEAPTQVYELNGIVQTRSRIQASAARGLTRFVGRDSEVQQLAQALERAAAGHGQAVAIVGEAGVGKSRLVWEFTRSHRTHGWLVLESSSVSYGKATPYLPIIDLLKAYCRIRERDDAREIHERVAGKLLTLDRALESLMTPLLALLDVPVNDAAWDALAPPLRRQRTLEAVKRLLLRESQVQPLLMVFEDLHWIDSETQALLDSLIESLPTARVLLLVNYRPEYRHTWGSKTYYRQLRIDPLSAASAEALLSALLGEDQALEPLKRALIERTEGNPFFLEESVQMLVETQVLAGERGAYRPLRAPQAWQIPASAQAILAARIDRLLPEDKRLLQAASVIGKDVPFALLQAIADTSDETLRQSLTHLQGAEFLYETSLFPDLEYTFKHALTHEVAYGSLLQERRRLLHARVMEAVERQYADRLIEQAERLGHHAFHAEAWQQAVTYLHQAGTKARACAAFRQAASSLEQALAALANLPHSAALTERAIDIRLDLRDVLQPLGEFNRITENLRAAAHLAADLGDQKRVGWVSAFLANQLTLMGELSAALVEGERALVSAGSEDEALWARATISLGQTHLARGNYRELVGLMRDVIHRMGTQPRGEFRGFLGGPPTVPSRCWLAVGLAEQGAFEEAQAVVQDGISLAEGDHPIAWLHAYHGAGLTSLRQGESAQAVRAYELGWRIVQELEIPFYFVWMGSWLAAAYAAAGRLEEALPIFRDASTQASRMGLLGFSPMWMTEHGGTCLLAGDYEMADHLGRQALKLARTHGERGHEAYALRLLGDVALGHAALDWRVAATSYEESERLANELGMRPLVAHCHLGLGKLYGRAADKAKAEKHLQAAVTMYREMDMGFWLEKTEAALRSLG